MSVADLFTPTTQPVLQVVPAPEPEPDPPNDLGVSVFTTSSLAGQRSYGAGRGWVQRPTGQLDVLDGSGTCIATWAPGHWSGIEVVEADTDA